MPPDPFRDPKVAGNPNITTIITAHGGHCGFVGESARLRGRQNGSAHDAGANGDDGYRAERAVGDFIARVVTRPVRS